MPRNIDDQSKSFVSLNSPRRVHGSLVETSPSMVTRSHCSGECPSNALAGSGKRRTRATGSVNLHEHLHHHDHDHHHHHHHKDSFLVDPKLSLAEISEDEIEQRVFKRSADDDSSDEEITLIRRTTNKIMTTIENSSRKMNSVHSSCSKYAFLTIFLPILVFLFSWYYYDYSPRVFPYQQQSSQGALLPVSSASPSHGQPIPFSSGQSSFNSQSFCNSTASCPSSEEIAILNKRLDRLEQLVFKLTEEITNSTKYINTIDEKVQKLGVDNRKSFDSVEEKFVKVSQKIQEAVEVNKQITKNKETASVEEIEGMIKQAIYLYDSDKTGKADYALESSGGSIVTSRCSETYDPYGIKYSVWGIPIWYTSNSPRTVIQASMIPGECWAFPGSMGNVTIKLSARIIPTEFSYEHINKEISRDGNIKSAPKVLQIRGLKDENDHEGVLLGNYVYLDNDNPLQHFEVQVNKGRPFNYITFIILNNHGHPDYTCLYRFRVHGRKV
ncbi:spindle pole body-associated protein sad1 [Tetranychus urticae]|uniref:SUN domain-containing protein n=1 Tax=Tetranychus urticae TaxID=32264 RepID=T1KR87_TETUR|nr:spindle pole body-associated protein sad1 [Tetranychus urticae]